MAERNARDERKVVEAFHAIFTFFAFFRFFRLQIPRLDGLALVRADDDSPLRVPPFLPLTVRTFLS